MKKFMTIWTGQLISNIGSGMTVFALSIYVYQLTGNVTSVSIVTLLAYLPTILLSPVGGILADIFDRRLMMICGDFFSAFGLLYILISINTGHTGILPIAIGVTINSVFVSLLNPAYKATVTDLLTEDEYVKASGLMQIAGNAKYLISPAIAGIILAYSDIRVILIIDILTIIVTILVVALVRRNIHKLKPRPRPRPRQGKIKLYKEFKEGVQYISKDKGVTNLVFLMALVCFFIGFVQILIIPLLLSIGSIKTAGFIQTISAIGMLVSSVIISAIGIKKHYSKILILSLIACGCFMGLIGTSTSIAFILASSILFFATLPVVNTCADVLIRVRIPNEVQGRVWGLISLFTQTGYVVAYLICGILADNVFGPMMEENSILAGGIGKIIGIGEGRGIGLMLIIAGVSMVSFALVFGRKKRRIEIEVVNY